MVTKKADGPSSLVVFNPFAKINKIASSYTDEKIVLARKLARQGLTFEQMAPLLGYKHSSGVIAYFKVNNLPKPIIRAGNVNAHSEAQKKAQANRMKQYWATTGTHQNVWGDARKDTMKISLPAWAEEAAELRRQGMSGIKIAKKLGVSDVYVYTTLNIMNGKGTTNVPWAKDAIHLANEGKTNEEIAKILAVGVTAGRVKQVLAQHNAAIQYRKKKERQQEEADAMADRTFEKTSQTIDGVTRNAMIIRCGVDGCKHSELFVKSHGVINPTHAAQYFRNKGWLIGGGPRADRCPEHAHKTKTAHHEPVKPKEMSPFHPVNNKPEQKQEGIMASHEPATVKAEDVFAPKPFHPKPEPTMVKTSETVTVEQVKPEAPKEEPKEAPKEMSKADRRIIFNKIEDVYGDETIGYKGDWSDAKVSDDLGVPVEWVALIREENFGPARNQALALEEMKALNEKVTAMETELHHLTVMVSALGENFNKALARYEEAKAATEKLIAEYRELYKKTFP